MFLKPSLIITLIVCNVLGEASPVLSGEVDLAALKSEHENAIVGHTKAGNCEDLCLTPGCIAAANSILKRMDPSINPCNNFYQFACGKYLNETQIPESKSQVSSFTEINDDLLNQLKIIIAERKSANETRPFKMVKQFYDSCMNTERIEKLGLEPMKSVLKKLGGWPVLDENWDEESFDWKETVYKLRKEGFGIGSIITFLVIPDLKNSTRRSIYIDQSDFGKSLTFLKKGNEMEESELKESRSYMVDVAVAFGAERELATEELSKSYEFENQLFEIADFGRSRLNFSNLYNPMTISEVQEKFPSIPWLQYINSILAPVNEVTDNEVVIMCASNYTHQLEALLSNTSKAVGSMYVKRFFNKDTKQKMKDMVERIHKALDTILSSVDWMDEQTRKNAIHKSQAMLSAIAYPDELLDDRKIEEYYAKLEIPENDFFGSLRSLKEFTYDDSFSKLHEPVNKTEWSTHGKSAEVNAFYYPLENSIQLPAGILQGVLYSNERPEYMNYGSIGYVIGHEITHGFDNKGSQYDENGNLADWWDPKTKERFLEKANCIIDQYSNYTVGGIELNGNQTLGENIADNGGVKEAYYAYQSWAKCNGPEPRLPGLQNYSPEQMFWLSAASTWCTKSSPLALLRQIITDVHSPAAFRIIGPLSNNKEFAHDFNCPLGSRMNPEKKCQVW